MIRQLLQGLFGIIGIEAFFYKKRSYTDFTCLDRNMLEWFYDESKERELYKQAMAATDMEWSDNFTKQCRHHTLQQLVRRVLAQGIEGDLAECGCWKGTSAYQIAAAMQEAESGSALHIFDSFEGGLSDKKNEDINARIVQSGQQIEQEKQGFASSEKEVQDNLGGFDFVLYYRGWIPERFPEVEEQRFSFVHIDVDLYEPTKQSLEFFFERLHMGGVIVVDDYGYTQFPGAKRAVDEFLVGRDVTLFYESPIGGCFLIK